MAGALAQQEEAEDPKLSQSGELALGEANSSSPVPVGRLLKGWSNPSSPKPKYIDL